MTRGTTSDRAATGGRRQGATSEGVTTLLFQIRAMGLPAPIEEHRFHPMRRFRFDLAWPDRLLAVEVDGGAFIGGRHNTGAGARSDAEKVSLAVAAGWRVMRVLPEHVTQGVAIGWIAGALAWTPGHMVGWRNGWPAMPHVCDASCVERVTGQTWAASVGVTA
jgi:very-short-patch-repair endonuclease